MGILSREEMREEIEAILRGVFNYGAKMGRWETAETNYIPPENAFKMIEALIEHAMKGRGGECKAATIEDSGCAAKRGDDKLSAIIGRKDTEIRILRQALEDIIRSSVGFSVEEQIAQKALSGSPSLEYASEDLQKCWPVKCAECGWRGLSKDCAGGGSIADPGEHDEVVCPECFKGGKFIPVEACFVSSPAHGVKLGRIAPSWDEYLLWL
jgi:hypothetical protein